MWKWTGRWRSAHTSQSGSQSRWARSGEPASCGSEVMFTPRKPRPAQRSASRTHSSMLHAGSTGIGRNRLFDHSCSSAMRVVVDLDAQPPQHRVVRRVGEVLAADADRVGVDDLRVDAALVHQLEPRPRGPTRPGGPGRCPRPCVSSNGNLSPSRSITPPARAGPRGAPSIVHIGLAVDLGDLGDTVLVALRRPRREQVVALGHVRVGVDDADFVGQCHVWTPAPQRCERPRTSAPEQRTRWIGLGTSVSVRSRLDPTQVSERSHSRRPPGPIRTPGNGTPG